MKRSCVSFILLFSLVAVAQDSARPQPGFIHPGDNLVVESIPPVPLSIVEKADRYTEFRSATFFDWDPTRREMLVGTRFADVQQVHLVKMAGGARSQLTFFP